VCNALCMFVVGGGRDNTWDLIALCNVLHIHTHIHTQIHRHIRILTHARHTRTHTHTQPIRTNTSNCELFSLPHPPLHTHTHKYKAMSQQGVYALAQKNLIFWGVYKLLPPHVWVNEGRCVRCLLITESPKTPSHYRYQIQVLGVNEGRLFLKTPRPFRETKG